MSFIVEALDSIYAQTLEDWELIIVQEFNAVDGTPEYLKTLNDPRLKIVFCEKHMGISAALNMGLDRAKGQYIARMDDDDICQPERLAEQVDYLQTRPDVGLCGTKVEIFGDYTWDWPVNESPVYNRASMLFYQPVIHPTFMMRKKILDEFNIRYNPAFNATEDYEILSRLVEVTDIGNVGKTLLRYRRHVNVATMKQTNGVALLKKVQDSLFNRIGLYLTPTELDTICVLGSWRQNPARENFERTVPVLLRLFREVCYANHKAAWCDDIALQQVIKRRWNEHFDGAAFPEKERLLLLDRYERDFSAEMSFLRYLYNKPAGHQRNPELPALVHDAQMSTPLVSIVLPTYNVTDRIERCLHSLLVQTFENFELLIINDGSSLMISTIVAKLNDSRIRLINNDIRLGLAESLNLGLREARGRFIARADADDYYSTDRLKIQLDFMNKNPHISLCTTYQEHIDDWGRVIKTHCPGTTPELQKANALFKCDVCHSTVVLRRDDFIDRNLYYNSDYLMEDYELWSRAVHQLNFAAVTEFLARYQVDDHSVTAQKGFAALNKDLARILKCTLARLDISLPPEDEFLLHTWENQYYPQTDPAKKPRLERLLRFLDEIWQANRDKGHYDPEALRRACEDHLYLHCPPESNAEIYYKSQFGTPEAAARNSRKLSLVAAEKISAEKENPPRDDQAGLLPEVGMRSGPKSLFRKLLTPIVRPFLDPIAEHIAFKSTLAMRPVIYEALNNGLSQWSGPAATLPAPTVSLLSLGGTESLFARVRPGLWDAVQKPELLDRYALREYQQEFFDELVQRIDLENKRILQIGGGHLPYSFTHGLLKTAKWVRMEKKPLEVTGFRPDIENKITIVTPDSLARLQDLLEAHDYLIYNKEIQDMGTDFAGQFDICISHCHFQQIAPLGLALDNIHQALIPGGLLYSRFGPIWSSKAGSHFWISENFNHASPGPMPDYAHLLLSYIEILELLRGSFPHESAARLQTQATAIKYGHSQAVNRFFYEDYVAVLKLSKFGRSFSIGSYSDTYGLETQIAELKRRYPPYQRFEVFGVELCAIKNSPAG